MNLLTMDQDLMTSSLSVVEVERDHVLFEKEAESVIFKVSRVVEIDKHFHWMNIARLSRTIVADFLIGLFGKSEVDPVLEYPIVSADLIFQDFV